MKCKAAYATLSTYKVLPKPRPVTRRVPVLTTNKTTYLPMALFKGLVGIASAFLIFCGPATSLVINPAISLGYLDRIGNLSSSPLKSRCTHSPHWMGRGYDVDDCALALRSLFWAEVRRQPLKIYEFFAEGEIPSSEYPTVKTPMRFVQGTCTVAIVMLKFFDGAGVRLPDQPEVFPVPGSATATWQSLWGAANMVHMRCGVDSAMGWGTGGFEGGIGVFMWGTGAAMDRSVP